MRCSVASARGHNKAQTDVSFAADTDGNEASIATEQLIANSDFASFSSNDFQSGMMIMIACCVSSLIV